jgi:lipid-binding SYLF domain-containing protein
MNKPASRTRMTTPVGMAQGKFTHSGAQVANSFDNRGLFKGMSVDSSVLNAKESAMLAKPAGPVEGDVLMNLVKRAVNEKWVEKGVMR